MHGGVNAISDGEMIYLAEATDASPLIEQVLETWKDLLEIVDLFHYSMNLSSTDSDIDIVCKSVTITNVNNHITGQWS